MLTAFTALSQGSSKQSPNAKEKQLLKAGNAMQLRLSIRHTE